MQDYFRGVRVSHDFVPRKTLSLVSVRSVRGQGWTRGACSRPRREASFCVLFFVVKSTCAAIIQPALTMQRAGATIVPIPTPVYKWGSVVQVLSLLSQILLSFFLRDKKGGIGKM